MFQTLLPVFISGALVASGFVGTFWPALVHSLDTDNDPTIAPTPQQIWSVRIGSFVMFLLGCAGIYAILTCNGMPPEGPLF